MLSYLSTHLNEIPLVPFGQYLDTAGQCEPRIAVKEVTSAIKCNKCDFFPVLSTVKPSHIGLKAHSYLAFSCEGGRTT